MSNRPKSPPAIFLSLFLKPIIASAEQFWAVANPEKGISPAQIAEAARKEGGRGVNQAGSWAEALEQIRPSSTPTRILITGSLYLVGHVLTHFQRLAKKS